VAAGNPGTASTGQPVPVAPQTPEIVQLQRKVAELEKKVTDLQHKFGAHTHNFIPAHCSLYENITTMKMILDRQTDPGDVGVCLLAPSDFTKAWKTTAPNP
jgi:hypothetical protein